MNYSTHNQQMRKMHSTHRKPNYALRKLSVGVASVLLSTTIFGLSSMAHADTVTPANGSNNNSTDQVDAGPNQQSQSIHHAQTVTLTKSSDSNKQATHANDGNSPENTTLQATRTDLNAAKQQIPAAQSTPKIADNYSNSNPLNSSVQKLSLATIKNQANLKGALSAQLTSQQAIQKAASNTLTDQNNLSVANSNFSLSDWDIDYYEGNAYINGYHGAVTGDTLVVPNTADLIKLGAIQAGKHAYISQDDVKKLANTPGISVFRISNTPGGQLLIPTTDFSDWQGLFEDSKLKVIDLSGLDMSHVTSIFDMFFNARNLEQVTLGSNLNNLTNAKRLFLQCSSLKSINFNNWSTAKLASFYEMFEGCSALESIDLITFNTAKATDMREMFRDCSSLTRLDVSGFDTSKVQYMDQMFTNCSLLESISGINKWNTANLMTSTGMFYGNSALKSIDITNWNLPQLNDITRMFCKCTSLNSIDLSGWHAGNGGSINVMNATEAFGQDQAIVLLPDTFISVISDSLVAPYMAGDLLSSNLKKVNVSTRTYLPGTYEMVPTYLNTPKFQLIKKSDLKKYVDPLNEAIRENKWDGFFNPLSSIIADVQNHTPVNDLKYGDKVKSLILMNKLLQVADNSYVNSSSYSGDADKAKIVLRSQNTLDTQTEVTLADILNNTFILSAEPTTQPVSDIKHVTRTIEVTNPDGTTKSTKQTATLTRTGTKDLVTNDTTWGDWSTSQWDAFTAPEIKGYTAPSVDETPVNGDTTDTTVNLTYTANDQTITVKYMDGDKEVKTETIKGKSDEQLPFTANVPTNYHATGDVPTTITVDPNGNQVITIQLGHDTTSVNDSKDVMRTINVTNPDGTTTTTKQTTTLTRTGTKDLVTNDTTWGDWSTSQWDAFTAPEVKGYKPSQATVDAQTVNGQTQDQIVNITYTPIKEIWTKTDEQKTYTYEYRTWYQYKANGVYYTQPVDNATTDWYSIPHPFNPETIKIVINLYSSNLGNKQWRINREASQNLDKATADYIIPYKPGYSIYYADSHVSDDDLTGYFPSFSSSDITKALGHEYDSVSEQIAKKKDVTIPNAFPNIQNDIIENINDLSDHITDIFYVSNIEPVVISLIDPNQHLMWKEYELQALYGWQSVIGSLPLPDSSYHYSKKTGKPLPNYDVKTTDSYIIIPKVDDNFTSNPYYGDNHYYYYIEKNQNTTSLNPFDKATVKDPEHLTDDEKGQVVTNIKKTNEDKHISTIEVGDDGNTTLTFEDGTKSELTPDQTIISYKSGDSLINTGDADADLNPFDKTPVKDPTLLTNDEKGQVQTNIKKTNSDKHISTIDVKDNGRTIITFEDGTQKELTPDQTIIAYKSGDPLINTGDADADLNPFDKTPVKDPTLLTDDEKGQVQTNIKKTNGDKHISTIDVKDNGRTIITFEDGTQKELTPDETITQLPAEKPETPTVTPEEQSTTTGRTNQPGTAVIGTSTTKPVVNQSSAQQQKQQRLPQTGDNHEAAIAGLGLAVAMMSMFGLKKRKED